VDEGLLVSNMQEAAERFAAAHALTFSLDSLGRVEELLLGERDTARQREAGAYIGEVLVRQGPSFRWAWPPRGLATHGGQPELRAANDYWFAPHWWAERCQKPLEPGEGLVEIATQILTFVEDPTDETATWLGWSGRSQWTNGWDGTRRELQRLAAWWRERRYLRRNGLAREQRE
jgi:hypothetical protein